MGKNDIINDIIDDYGQGVWDYVFSITRNPDLTDDVTQECFIKAYTHLDSFRNEATMKTWLFRIARNCVYDYRRSAFFRKVTLTQRFPHGVVPSAETQAFEQLRSKEVWSLVLSLPEKLREVLVLNIQHQFSVSEIANLLSISERAVRSRLFRARTRMKTLLQDGDCDEQWS